MRWRPSSCLEHGLCWFSLTYCSSLVAAWCPRSGKDTNKRNLTLVDDTCTEITLTLWGDLAKQDEMRWMGNPVIAFKGIKVTSRYVSSGDG